MNVISQGNREMNTAEGFIITTESIGGENQTALYIVGTVNIQNTKLVGAQGGGTVTAQQDLKSDMANAANSNAIS